MLFNSLDYAFFLVLVFALFWLLADRPRPRNLMLLAASYVFYGSWNAKYLLLILFSSSLDFVVGRALGRTEDQRRRRLLLAASVVVNLGLLATFKYFNFFVESATGLAARLGLDPRPLHLDVLLPVGISFYTFQTLSYVIDVYRRQLAPARGYFDYLLFVSFFPQLVAGPIVRAKLLLPQFDLVPRITREQGGRALWLIALGLAKKALVADFLGCQIVDQVFSNPAMYSSLETLCGVYAYAFQIYADFSAYSDIAIGSAMLLGFELPRNFDSPYLAASLREFWQRWHISLSTWLRDYLYVPLGGSRGGAGATYVNLVITMLLGGLWHGAAWTFVIWGALHGTFLVATRVAQRAGLFRRVPARLVRPLGVLVTFHLVCLAWIFFRAPDLETALAVLASLGQLTAGGANLAWPVLGALGLGVVTHALPDGLLDRLRDRFAALPVPAQAALFVALLLGVEQVVSRIEVAPFIYFQF